MCDFWARIKIRKRPENDLVRDMRESIVSCQNEIGLSRMEAMQHFWAMIGVRNLNRLCEEEPDLCAKMKRVEKLA